MKSIRLWMSALALLSTSLCAACTQLLWGGVPLSLASSTDSVTISGVVEVVLRDGRGLTLTQAYVARDSLFGVARPDDQTLSPTQVALARDSIARLGVYVVPKARGLLVASAVIAGVGLVSAVLMVVALIKALNGV